MARQSTWTPPLSHPPAVLPPEVSEWLDANACVTLATLEPDGRPQLSVLWAKQENNTIMMATVAGRRKHRNLLRDPRATVLITPPGSGDHYVEVRGVVDIVLDGGRELIDELHERQRGKRPYPWDGEDDVRLVLKLVPDRVLVFHG
ncbi:TIGR03618 family F420-dependent PPOX class oxidoreductase [Lentzea flaviverrucosa]|uniref:PPOX class probable F420-dependent enzyme n=1 Tax=Lentzea flaviverrucosa TaxID=200379 RepID=A0A1H9WU84_9PSEU|nr:TIGR03618 family F420-dependent PPOX class oxidoreductase [Lentzea flaviverrucosa]RDI23103.1 PPOX class probable F420-dependent enzyme [Lentzea flaviverrucosa]SES37394.1 PPOX class probable F420-dependent enzyme [Lentzea flaviverrucosa]